MIQIRPTAPATWHIRWLVRLVARVAGGVAAIGLLPAFSALAGTVGIVESAHSQPGTSSTPARLGAVRRDAPKAAPTTGPTAVGRAPGLVASRGSASRRTGVASAHGARSATTRASSTRTTVPDVYASDASAPVAWAASGGVVRGPPTCPVALVVAAESGGAGTAVEPMWAQAPNDGFLGGWRTTETLQPGTLIDRYGAETGRFFSPAGTSLEARALPWGQGPLNGYEVLKPFDVQGGIVAPAFGQAGLGVQYMSPQTVADLIEGGFIKPVAP